MADQVCGDFGGQTKSGDPCQQPVDDGRCWRHKDDAPAPQTTFPEDDELTEKQRRFVEAYMGRAEGNGAEAYRLAGYSAPDDGTASSGAHHLLTNHDIRAAIEARVRRDPLVADRAEVQRFFTDVMRGEATEPDGSEPRIKERIRAAEQLTKTRGGFQENVDITSDGEQVESTVFVLPDNGRRRDG